MGSPYNYIFNSINIVGFILILITSIIELTSSPPKSSVNLYGLTMGYILVAIGTTLQGGYMLNHLNRSLDITGINYIIHLISSIGPLILAIGVSIYISYLLSYYKKPITAGHTSNDFHTLMSIITSFSLLTIAQIIYWGIKNKPTEITNWGQVSGLIIYLFNTINIISVLMLGAVLNYFTTDG